MQIPPSRLEVIMKRACHVCELKNQFAVKGVELLPSIELHERDRAISLYSHLYSHIAIGHASVSPFF
jgi:hypothetical protein